MSDSFDVENNTGRGSRKKGYDSYPQGSVPSDNQPKPSFFSKLKRALPMAVLATALALFLSGILTSPFTASISTMFASPEKKDFCLTDLYSQVADSRPMRVLDDSIVLIDIGHSGRPEIAECLELVSLCDVKAIGVDINFPEPSDNDSLLLAALEVTPRLVLPVTVDAQQGRGKFKLASHPFFYGELHGPDSSPRYGVVNLPSEREGGSIREYMSYFPMAGKEKYLPSFVMAMAMTANPALDPMRKKNNQTIDYTSREFTVIPIDEVEEHLEELNNRYIIIGAMGETSDMHATPVNSYMPGMLVHAYSLSTLLSGKRFTTMPGWIDYALATLLCLVLVLTALMHTGKTKGILLRIIQVFMLIGLVWTGYVLYIDRMIICDFSRTLLIILFSLFALDICNGLDGLIALVREKVLGKLRKNKI